MRQGLFLILSLIALTSALDTINQLFLKSAINSVEPPHSANIIKIIGFIFRLICKPRVWLSGIFALMSLSVWLLVLSKADLNFAFSADSMHYLFIAFASSIFLKEKVGMKRWLGTISIVIGIVLVSLT
ncbi:MAG: hypothetical protein KJ880_08450 [Candidatus Omnitrophica bacterium]|nr:hypothetical protein [Candidatus Omnitrophota bacterium]